MRLAVRRCGRHDRVPFLAEARVSPSFFFRVPENTPRTVWRCQPVALTTSSTVAPSGRRSIAIRMRRDLRSPYLYLAPRNLGRILKSAMPSACLCGRNTPNWGLSGTPGTESSLTLRWREPDSNHRSRSCERHFWASPIGDDGGATYRFRPETTMLAWSGSP